MITDVLNALLHRGTSDGPWSKAYQQLGVD